MIYLFLPFNHLIRGISLWYVHLDSVSMTCIASFNWQLSFSYIFCHVSNCYPNPHEGKLNKCFSLRQQILTGPACRCHIFSVNRNLKGPRRAARDTWVANLPNFMSLPFKCFTHNKLQQWQNRTRGVNVLLAMSWKESWDQQLRKPRAHKIHSEICQIHFRRWDPLFHPHVARSAASLWVVNTCAQ